MIADIKRECRFYVLIAVSVIFGYFGMTLPPEGVVSSSVLFLCTLFACIGSLAVGLDIEGLLREIRLLRQTTIEELKLQNQLKEKKHE